MAINYISLRVLLTACPLHNRLHDKKIVSVIARLQIKLAKIKSNQGHYQHNMVPVIIQFFLAKINNDFLPVKLFSQKNLHFRCLNGFRLRNLKPTRKTFCAITFILETKI